MTPVFAQDRKSDVGGAVRIGGVRIEEPLDNVEVLIQGLDLGIAGPGQDLLLDEEGGAANAVDDLVAVSQAVVGDDVQHVVAVSILVDQAGLLGLNVRPQTGGLLSRAVVQQVDQSAAADDQVRAVTAAEQVRIVLAGDFHAQGLVQVASEIFKLEGNAELFFDQLVDLVVLSRLITGVANEGSQSDGFEGIAFSHHRGDERKHHGQRQQGREKFPHDGLLHY